MMHMQQERDMANKFILSILKYKCHRETCGTYASYAIGRCAGKQMGGFIMETHKKRISRGLIVIGVLVVLLAVFYVYVHFSTTPEEEAYAAAVQRVVELSDERYNKAQQEEEEKIAREKETESRPRYVEKVAREKEAAAQPYFDKYREEYVVKEGDGYLVKMPVQEMLNDKVVKEYTYEIYVEERNGEYVVVSMNRKESE